MAGKGDRPRPVDREKWEDGWERTFGKDERDRKKSLLSLAIRLTRAADEGREFLPDSLDRKETEG